MSFYVNQIGDLEYLCADSLNNVLHGFSTRYGGVSTGIWSSLNLGTHRGDDPANVRENYRLFCAALGIEQDSLIFASQIHSDIVAAVDHTNRGEGLDRPVSSHRDAMISNTPGTSLVVFSADCAPVLLYDPDHRAIGAAHSGWRGTAQDIAGKTVLAMVNAYASDPARLQAAIGPCLGPCCFETDADVPQAMAQQLGSAAEEAVEKVGDKYYVNNSLLIRMELERAGLRPECIDISTDCTSCQPERFWSYRRVGQNRGSLAAIIAL